MQHLQTSHPAKTHFKDIAPPGNPISPNHPAGVFSIFFFLGHYSVSELQWYTDLRKVDCKARPRINLIDLVGRKRDQSGHTLCHFLATSHYSFSKSFQSPSTIRNSLVSPSVVCSLARSKKYISEILYRIYERHGAAVNMRKTPRASGRGGMSAFTCRMSYFWKGRLTVISLW